MSHNRGTSYSGQPGILAGFRRLNIVLVIPA